ncbi:MAG: T9SS type A sorting domain-containing protein [Candidatus Marinimicrobia bacterium]|nr:T9SS type A sorting domain-containing protein [Candidatus Neomarinimicrobiota bacterium]
MKKMILILLVLALAGLAQTNNSVVAEVDYFNATRYSGARNIARTSDGNIFVVFEPAADYTEGNMEIHYVTYNSFFNEWDPAVPLSQSTENATGIPAVVADDAGRVFASWKELSADGMRDMMFCKWESGSWSTPIVADDIDNNAGVGTINIGPDGDLFISFSIWNDPAVFDPNIYVSQSSDMGVNWNTTNLTTEYPTPGELPFNYMDSDIAPLEDTQMMAVWEDKPLPETNQYEIMMSIMDAENNWSTPEIISPYLDGTPQVARYIDGCTPRTEAVSIYEFSGFEYPLAGQSNTIYYDNGSSKVLSTFMNPYYQFPLNERDSLVASVLNFFGVVTSGSILFVDDDNKWNNEAAVTEPLDNLGFSYTTFDCGDIGGIPTDLPPADSLTGYDLVIWFTGDDGVLDNLALWDVQDIDNTEVTAFLDAGGELWIVGRDWMYDRYGAADAGPEDSFSTGDFCYDYLGIQSYDSQSYTEADGTTGVAYLNLVDGTGFAGLDPLGWGNAGVRDGEPVIAADPSGNVHMAFYRANGSHIHYMKYQAGSWSNPVQIDASADTLTVQRPSITVDPNHGVYITWMERNDEGIYNVMYRTSPDAGSTWNDVAQLSACDYVNATNYSIKNPTLGRKVREAGIGFGGGADVIWTQADENSSLGYYIMYGNIPYVGTVPVGVDGEPQVVESFELTSVYPNPFNPSVNIEFVLHAPAMVDARIYDLSGREVAVIVEHRQVDAGQNQLLWNASGFASGVYLLKLESQGKYQIQKLTLLK